ncbi:hypothetical protein E2C01_065867 [Portunus trituberculatus]|uniref:Uncharacterized protein n=1 Tax=Portunus trituberculatus TaxID=210409 RepID=A0A5B7HQT9_PORTR|nr:hypothetical protein [Portunus trituberculatus]
MVLNVAEVIRRVSRTPLSFCLTTIDHHHSPPVSPPLTITWQILVCLLLKDLKHYRSNSLSSMQNHHYHHHYHCSSPAFTTTVNTSHSAKPDPQVSRLKEGGALIVPLHTASFTTSPDVDSHDIPCPCVSLPLPLFLCVREAKFHTRRRLCSRSLEFNVRRNFNGIMLSFHCVLVPHRVPSPF